VGLDGVIAYFDLFSGISGDMALGALVDLGLPIALLREELEKLGIRGDQVQVENVLRGGIRAKRVAVTVLKEVPREYAGIRRLLEESSLRNDGKEKAMAVFDRLAEVEAMIHGVPLSEVRFHEIGATDSIIDIVGVTFGISYLGIDRVYFSSFPLTTGEVRTEHGLLPLPAPATAALLEGLPTHWIPLRAELVTPTGAAILAVLGSPSEDLANMILRKVGYGAGKMEIPGRPNVLRVFLAEQATNEGGEACTLLETNIDDMCPEIYEHIIESLFEAGAVDVWLTPIVMKKSRPGTMLQVLFPGGKEEAIVALVFRESTTLGVRLTPVRRVILPRAVETVLTPLGTIRVKVGKDEGTVAPEYEDCRKVARETGTPLKRVYELAILCYRNRQR
jgi:hypothetical protein